MAKLPNYNGTIDLISGLRAKNNGDFPLMEAHDVQVTEEKRLDEMFSAPESWLPVYDGENEGGAEGGGTGGGNYVLELSGESGTLTDQQYQAVVDNFPNVVASYSNAFFGHSSLRLGNNFIFIGEYPETLNSPTENIKKLIVLVEQDKTYALYSNVSSGGGETFKTRLTTVFSGEPTSLTTEDMTAFQNALYNITPVTQIIFKVQGEESIEYVGFLQNSYTDLEANTLNLVYESPLYKITITANISEGTIVGYFELNEETTSSGLTKTKVTLAELQALVTEENVGTQVFIQVKYAIKDIVGEDVYNALVFAGLGNFITVISMADAPFIACTNTVYARSALNSFSILITLTIGNTATIQQYDFTTNTASTPSSLSSYFNDDYFDFYIYK